MNRYRSADWKAFRNEVIRLDGGRCVRCCRSPSDGVVLQVHHKRYSFGLKPWEYPHDLCETLCRGCHAEEHGKIIPRFDWEHVGYDDLGEPSGACDYCGTSIRYVFLVQHEKWSAMEVGEICCDNLTCTLAASEHMDSARRHMERRKRFVSSCRWSNDEAGACWIRQNSIALRVIPIDGAFKLHVNGTLGRLVFQSIIDAKMKAFDLIESGTIARYFRNPRA